MFTTRIQYSVAGNSRADRVQPRFIRQARSCPAFFADIPAPRAGTPPHPLPSVLAIATAVLCGASGYNAISQRAVASKSSAIENQRVAFGAWKSPVARLKERLKSRIQADVKAA